MKRILLKFAILMIALAACTNKPVLESNFFSAGCEKPCWLGMRPQITTGVEAEEILKHHITDETGDMIRWKWDEKLDHIGLILLDETRKIDVMSVGFAKGEIMVAYIIDILSVPDYVRVIPNWSDTTKSQCLDAELIYTDDHIIVSIYDNIGSVRPEYSVAALEFRSPSPDNSPWWSTYDAVVHEWSGYKDYCYKIP